MIPQRVCVPAGSRRALRDPGLSLTRERPVRGRDGLGLALLNPPTLWIRPAEPVEAAGVFGLRRRAAEVGLEPDAPGAPERALRA